MKALVLIYFALIQICSIQGVTLEVFQQRAVVNSSELAIFPITPSLFKWEKQQGYVNQIDYIPKIENFPDLPSWLRFTYDGYSSTLYLYGVPPSHLSAINLEVIGCNKGEAYDVRKLLISVEIIPRPRLQYLMEMKIDSMDVKELATPRRMGDLVKILTQQLGWTRSDGGSIIPVFMASAVELGENRVPTKPTDAEGVVIHFASDQDFSPELKKLQAEVLPLWKLRPCPRDLKRTSVERHFRKFNFLVDWCSFHLATSSPSSEELGSETDGKGGNDMDEGFDHKEHKSASESEEFIFKGEIPERDYSMEILMSTVIPGSIGGLVGFLIIILLRTDRDEDAEISEEALFFEAAFRTLFSMLRIKRKHRHGNGNGNGGGDMYIYHRAAPQVDTGVVVMTRDTGLGHQNQPQEISHAPIPPQYGETHPNGSPALIYAV